MKSGSRPYDQKVRASEANERTERILAAALELFEERPFDQITLAAVAERADVGLQTLIRRVGTKDGLVQAVTEWIGPQIEAARGHPTSSDPVAIAAIMARHYARWAAVTDRTLRQSDTSPALAASAAGGRIAHRKWINATFADVLAPLTPARRRRFQARFVALCGVELWLVLTRDEGLSVNEARDAIADLLAATLSQAAQVAAPIPNQERSS